jgi:alkaline phosphatase D
LSAPFDQAPAIVASESSRPGLPCGVATGDVADGRAIVWSRTDRPARMIVEYSTSPTFRDLRRVTGPAAMEWTDFTARVDLRDLPPGQRISYRVLFQDLSDPRAQSLPVEGTFRTASAAGDRDGVFAFSGDSVGQGWGIDRDRGGMALYDSMRSAEPDVFIHLGDTIYADSPLAREVTLDDGTTWRNVLTEEKSRVAQELGDFRGAHRYNFQDEHLRRFNSEVSQVVLWDDHEVRDNWFPTQRLDADARYTTRSVAILAARAKEAFFEYQPLRINADDPERIYRSWRHGTAFEIFALDMRSYRGPNTPNRQTELNADAALLGPTQVEWLKQALARSTSTWKVIASDMPIGLVVPDAEGRFEAVANGDAGPPLGRELEIAGLLGFIRDRKIRNVIWITADVHYAAAYHYDPARARFSEFLPFWEIVACPLHAGTFPASRMDPTFGPELRFLAIPPDMKPNRPPSDGFQFFGLGRVDRRTKALTMQIRNAKGAILFNLELPAER